MKICLYFKITEKPWGGGNSFFKYFRNYMVRNNFHVTDDVNSSYDILLVNGAHSAPGVYIRISDLKSIKKYGYINYKRFVYPNHDKKIFYRCDGFRDDYASIQSTSDQIQTDCLEICDYVIFQNVLCLESARNHGYSGSNYRIIHNGVDQEIFKLKENFWHHERNLKILSVSWSSNHNKGFSEIAEFSTLPNVESYFYGNWPQDVPKENVKVNPPIPHHKLADAYQNFDVLLHPARYDPSPNVCLEAISCGLPIIYHKTSGIKELANDCGIEYNEDDLKSNYYLISEKYDELINNILSKRNYFSITRTAEEYLNYFRSNLNEYK